ncbi:hypothetical protein ACFQ38_17365 [Sporosarcina contaminans]|uniref:TetR transcriptional regulator CgmR-like C-terminal domain-containing protein n=1 Tax=Sporosarcina contaminans TaxID=633403 RepID=A0ABW3U5B1_9BACL
MLFQRNIRTLRHLENDRLPPNKILLIQLAVDGLCYAQLFQIAPIDNSAQKQLFDDLQSLLEDSE